MLSRDLAEYIEKLNAAKREPAIRPLPGTRVARVPRRAAQAHETPRCRRHARISLARAVACSNPDNAETADTRRTYVLLRKFQVSQVISESVKWYIPLTQDLDAVLAFRNPSTVSTTVLALNTISR